MTAATLVPYPNFPGFPGFTKTSLSLGYKSISLRSPYTAKRQLLNTAFAAWSFKGTYSITDNVFGGMLKSFLTQLNGQANKFKLPLPEVAGPASGYTGNTGLVNGASQTGLSLITDGWTASTLIFKDGDHFTVNDELKIVQGDQVSDVSGNLTIEFNPPLRSSPADNLQLYIGNQVNLLQWSEDQSQTAWTKVNCTAPQGAADPNGGTAACTVTSAASGTLRLTQQIASFNPIYSAGRTFTLSVWLKSGTLASTNFNIQCRDGSNVGNFNTTSVAVTGAWQRFSFTVTFAAQATPGISLIVTPATNPTGAAQTFFMFGAQLEADVAVASTYKKTTTGDGKVYVMLCNTSDAAISWDVTPPVLYQVALDCMELIE